MNLSPEQLQETASLVDEIIFEIEQQQGGNQAKLRDVCSYYHESARNLLDYKTFRTFEVRGLQERLKILGLTRLANAEGNILGSLQNLRETLGRLLGETIVEHPNTALSVGDGNKILKKHAKNLFGKNGNNRRVRVMVTQPTEAAQNYEMVLEMVRRGMDCARINCAHDGPEVWESIIQNVRKAASACNTEIKIAMDLGGPKIRTGKIVPGPEVKKFRPKRDALGNVTAPTLIHLVPETLEYFEANELPVPTDVFHHLAEGDTLILRDTRDKRRKLKVTRVESNRAVVTCEKTLYVATGTRIQIKGSEMGKLIVGKVPPIEQFVTVKVGDTLRVTGNGSLGCLPEYDTEDNVVRSGEIPCVPKEILGKVRVGEPIFFDDGKIEGVIEEVHHDYMIVRIRKAAERGSKLRSEKGINLPESNIGMSGLTEKDKKDLKFVASHADIVNFSFVNSARDVQELIQELEQLQVLDKLSIVLKIETRKAFKNLVEILLSAMKTKYIGIMIARGDLALEVGWRNMGKVQDEILSLCSSAHIPVVWATQVLEGLAKKGLPSRSEITDIVSSIRTECVMLNKGPYINVAIGFLDEILCDMENRYEKKEGMLPKMNWS
nr:pyruvate kinase [Allomuricauda sp.]